MSREEQTGSPSVLIDISLVAHLFHQSLTTRLSVMKSLHSPAASPSPDLFPQMDFSACGMMDGDEARTSFSSIFFITKVTADNSCSV